MLALLEPIDESVLVRPLAAPKMTAGGIVIPDSSTETFNRGVVEKVGPGEWLGELEGRKPMPIDVGDLVFFGKYGGTWVELFGQTRLALRASECMFKVPAAYVSTVTHPEQPGAEHLVGEPCELCQELEAELAGATDPNVVPVPDAEELAARERLRELRGGLRIVPAPIAEDSPL